MEPLRVARGVYLSPPDHSLSARCAALLSALPAGTVLSGLTAAALHGLWLPPKPPEARLDVTVPTSGSSARLSHPRRPEVIAHRRRFGSSDVAVVEGLPVTSLARTWLDLSRTLFMPDLVAAGDSALRGGDLTLDALADAARASPDRRGLRRALRALTMLDARSRSRPESHLRVAATAPDLPRFAVNRAVADAQGQWLAEPDLSLREAMVALEYQGSDHAGPKRMQRDITRLTHLREAGWLVLLYGPAEVFRRPELIAPELRRILRGRAPHLLGRRRREEARPA